LMAVLHMFIVELRCSSEDRVIIFRDTKTRASLIRFI
jgi:hypothetical protein